MFKKSQFILVVVVLVASTLACNIPIPTPITPPPTATDYPTFTPTVTKTSTPTETPTPLPPPPSKTPTLTPSPIPDTPKPDCFTGEDWALYIREVSDVNPNFTPCQEYGWEYCWGYTDNKGNIYGLAYSENEEGCLIEVNTLNKVDFEDEKAIERMVNFLFFVFALDPGKDGRNWVLQMIQVHTRERGTIDQEYTSEAGLNYHFICEYDYESGKTWVGLSIFP